MARNFTPAIEIVLGYSNYEKVPGWFNKKITFDTLLNSMRYLGNGCVRTSLHGHRTEYGLSENAVLQAEGICLHLNLQRGEDDLFINETAVHTIHELKPALKV